MKKTEKYNIDDFRKLIILNVSLNDLIEQYMNTSVIFSEIDDFDDNETLKEDLEKILELLGELKTIRDNYLFSFIENHKNVTEETINEDTELYLKRRKNSWIDDD